MNRRAEPTRIEIEAVASSRPVAETASLDDRLLSIAETAGILGTAEYFVRGLVRDRVIPHVRIGRLIKIRRSVLGAYIDRNTILARSNP
jgi:excisionase family DNA binding protein